ncbi:unnamed protein product, partial [Scytosiphon promiscuus]
HAHASAPDALSHTSSRPVARQPVVSRACPARIRKAVRRLERLRGNEPSSPALIWWFGPLQERGKRGRHRSVWERKGRMGYSEVAQRRAATLGAARQQGGAYSPSDEPPLRPVCRAGGERRRRWENDTRYRARRESGSEGFGAARDQRLRNRGGRGRALVGSVIISAMTLSQASASALASSVGGVFRGEEAGTLQGGSAWRRLATCSGDSDCQGSDADMEALENDGLAISCDPACEDTGSDVYGGTWCDFLGLTGCRACDVYNCVGSSGSCVPCNGDAPDLLAETTPAPAEPGTTPSPVSPGSSPAPASADETDPPITIGEPLTRALPFMRPRNLQSSDSDSCTASACEDNADSADNAYISDNSLTLYCDDKCADTPTDPYGGLWCNMRGLGQLCRACRADNCVGWTISDTCLPCNELQPTPAPGATPAPSGATPAPSGATPAPSETESPALATPAPSETVAPVPATPAPSETVAPVLATPSPSETGAPVAETPAPSETVTPVDVTVSPAQTPAPVATAAPGETLAPDATAAPGETLAPDATAAPGETLAPDATAAP